MDGANLNEWDQFGKSVAAIGDINQDGIVELFIGCASVDDGYPSASAAYVIFLAPLPTESNGLVASFVKISITSPRCALLCCLFSRIDWMGTEWDAESCVDVTVGSVLEHQFTPWRKEVIKERGYVKEGRKGWKVGSHGRKRGWGGPFDSEGISCYLQP